MKIIRFLKSKHKNKKCLIFNNCKNEVIDEDSPINVIERYLNIQRKDISNDKGLKVRIDPESYVAKEIFYQTALLQLMSNDIKEIKRLLLKSNL